MTGPMIPGGNTCRGVAGVCTHRINHPFVKKMKYCTFWTEEGPLRPVCGECRDKHCAVCRHGSEDTYKCVECLAAAQEVERV